MHILLHPYKSGCQRKTFLCAVAAQMFHKVVPTTSEVRAQPACPHQAPPSPSLCGLETGRTRQVFGKQAVFLRRGGTVPPLALQRFPAGTAQRVGEASPGAMAPALKPKG